MKIAVIGAGHVGDALGTGWKRAGHDVTMVGRDGIAPAVAASDVVVLAVPWAAVESVIRAAGPLAGKTLFDCTNGAPAGAQSGGERVAAWAPSAHVVKIFNTTAFENMANPLFGTERATMFFAGDDAAAKQTAARLAADLGFDPVDAGALANARFLEMLASLWFALAFGQKMGRGIAFRLLRR
jgi:8-hydroxy-5-deazaflavin:NADPH oxidoreductase